MVRQGPVVHVHHRRAPLTMRTNGGRHKVAAILIVISSLQLVALATLSLADAPNGQTLRSSDTHEVHAAAATPIVASHDQLSDARSYGNDHDDDDDDEQAVDMNLMNAAQDKLMVMKDLLATTNSSALMAQQPRSSGPTQCTHKGRQYANGASVHIDEQPCLNCTCQMAILQCYLRVCPPIVSVEALRRKAQLASGLSGDTPHECRMVKEAHQCCPVMRCEPTGSAAGVTQQLSDELAPISNRSVNTSGQADQMTAAASSIVPVTSASVGGVGGADYLPKLTVINGPAGQRDSILLITSNPHASGLQTLSGGHFLRNRQTGNSSDQDQSPHGGGHPIVSSAPIIEALLETIYSSASNQLNGLNLQGSCMINGSLYFEGSAVLPEAGHALGQQSCQYCYCIRQKVMCVKPRCHLIISGCKPKYSNEFACCPTSYSCDSPAAPPTSGGLSARLTAGAPTSGGGTRLAQALEEALARVSRNTITTPPASVSLPALLANNDDAELTPRQVDGGSGATSGAGPVSSEDDTSKSTMLMFLSSLMTSPGESQANATTATTTTTTTSTTTTTTPEPTTTSSSTTSTTTTSTTSTTSTSTTTARPSSSGSSSAADEDEDERDEPEADGEEADRKRVTTTTTTTTGKPTTARSSTTEQSRSSVADFLEPMQKLGPHMGTPTTPAGCVENGRPYAIGEQIPSMENCRHCYCNTDGMKECKIVDCDLRGMQGCKPITREGHCCPVLFECPPSITMGGAPPASLTSGADFRELHQCTSATGEVDSCAGNKTGVDQAAPVLKSTRLVESTTGSGAANSSGDSLIDELQQFMMHIRSSNASSAPTALNTSSVEYAGVENSTSSAGSANETSSSGDENINKHTDYDSVRVPPTPSVSPIPPGMIGIPSIEPEVIGDLANDNRTETGSGQRDMRSTDAHALTASEKFEALNRMLDMSLVDISTPAINGQDNLVIMNVSQPTTSVDTDYVDLNNDTIDQRAPPMIVYHTINDEPAMPTSMSNGSKLARTSRDNSQNNNLWPGAMNNQTSVIFDDDLGAAIRRPPAAVIDPMPALFNHEQPFDNLEPSSTPSPPQPTTGTPIGLDAERALRPETTSWLRHLPAWTLNFGQRLSGAQDGFQGAASDGLQQGRGGVGLTPDATPTARSATSQPVARPNPFISMLKSIIATAAPGGHAQQQNNASPQARAANLVMRPLGIVAEHPTDATPPVAGRSPAPYEPALSPSELEIVTAPVPHEPEVFGLPADSTGSVASGGGNKELVVRASSSFARRSDVASSGDEQPEEGDHDDTPIVSGKRAPDEAADTSVQFFSSVATDAAAQQQPAGQFQVQVHKSNRSSELSTGSAQAASTTKLTCFDVATNKTYQLNERIPKLDNPCKACSCVLGRELCQPLVCPERPAENCREERRPGECCPNYLCELSTSAAPPSPSPTPQQHDTPTGFSSAPSNRLMVASPSPPPSPVVINQQQAQPQARMVQPRFSLPSSGYQIRTGDLASILPPHLRFRPNLLQANNQANSNQQAQMFNYDQTRLFFPNNQQLPNNNNNNNIRPQQQQHHRMLHNQQAQQAGEHQHRTAQGLNSAFISSAANSLIRPPLLMHPNQRQFIGSPARRNDDAPVQSINSIGSTGSQVVSFQKPSPPPLPPPQVISNLQQNTQHSTMRFPVPADARQMPAGAIAQHHNHLQVSGWRTTSGGPQLAMEQNIATNQQQQHQPKLAIIPPQMTPATGALPVMPPVDQKFTPLEHHQPGVASSPLVPLVAPATGSTFDSSGFRPIVAPAQMAQTTSSPSEPSSVDRIQDTPTSTIKYSQPIESIATGSAEPEVSESPATTSTLAPTSTSTSTTTPTPTTSTTEATPPPSPSTSSASTTTGSEAPTSGDQFSDPFAFKVSECDIYGRVYKVGQPIEELSDSCKRCTCTSSGVDCKSRC